MKQNKLDTLVNNTKWIYLGKGAFNHVAVSKKPFTIGNYTGFWVYKRQPHTSECSNPSRAVKKWNAINPSLPAYKVNNGWIAPYVEGKQASDLQIAKKLVEIYQRTRNIILDAFVKKNMRECAGEAVCVDVDYAINRSSFEDEEIPLRLEDLELIFDGYKEFGYVQSTAIIENLYYLESKIRGSRIDNQLLNFKVISYLTYFRDMDEIIIPEYLSLMNKMVALDTDEMLDEQFFSPEYIGQLLSLEHRKALNTKADLYNAIATKLIADSTPEQLIFKNHVNGLKIMLNQQPRQLGWRAVWGLNLLHLAVHYGRMRITKYLISQGISMEERTLIGGKYSAMTALEMAISFGSYELAHLLLESGALLTSKITDQPGYLFYAASMGNLALVQSLLQSNPDWIHAKDENKNYSALDWAIDKGHTQTTKILMQAGGVANNEHQYFGAESEVSLIICNDFEGLEILLNMNPSLVHNRDAQDMFPLHFAAYYGHLPSVTLLVEKGAKLFERINKSGFKLDKMTPLDLAIFKNHVEVARYLFEINPEIKYIHDRGRAMLFAAKHGLFSLLKALRDYDPKLVNARNENNQTPLAFAVAQGHDLIVAYLIQHRAALNPVIKKVTKPYYIHCADKYRTPLDLAIENKNEKIVALLLKAGARAEFYSARERPVKIKDSRYSLFHASSSEQSPDLKPVCSSSSW